MNKLLDLQREIKKNADSKKAKLLQRYFKTGKGEYGEGTIFIGVDTACKRELARRYIDLSLSDVERLLNNKIHDYRFTALVLLCNKFKKADSKLQKEIFKSYLKNTKNINNWDLVDISCHKIIGEYLMDKNREILYKLARSKNLWEKRIAIISTFAFVRKNDLSDTLKIAQLLLNDDHDLIHKAVGWALREVGKKNVQLEIGFLEKHYKKMPRTMLRYAIEKFPEKLRLKFLKK